MTNGFRNTGRDLHELFTIPVSLREYVNFCVPYCIVVLGVIEKSCQKLVLRVSSGVPNTSKQCFSVFGTPDGTLALVFEFVADSLGCAS